MVYTWKQDTLICGFRPQSEAIENDVQEINKINPEMKNICIKSVWSNKKNGDIV